MYMRICRSEKNERNANKIREPANRDTFFRFIDIMGTDRWTDGPFSQSTSISIDCD